MMLFLINIYLHSKFRNFLIGIGLVAAQIRVYYQPANVHVPEKEPKVNYMHVYCFPDIKSKKYINNQQRLDILRNFVVKKRSLLRIKWKSNYMNSSVYKKVKTSILSDERQKTYAKAHYYIEKDRIEDEFNSALNLLKNDMFSEYRKVSLNEKNVNKK